MMFLLISLSFLSMTLFCLAVTKHRQKILDIDIPKSTVNCLRPLGWVLTLVTAYVSCQNYGWSIGLAVYSGALTAGLIPLIYLITYLPKIIPILAIMVTMLSIITY